MNFDELKKKSQELSEKLKTAVEEADASYADPNFWKLTVDKAGNGVALIRFIPSPDDDGVPFAKYYSHQFKGPTGKWYVEKSLTTFGDADPLTVAA